jgi:hypothetical protein
MSEFQYYEFQAIHTPLDEKALQAVRALSTRAEITPTHFVNVYHFGNFRGNPEHLMEKYYDAFLYVANWGTHRLMLRLPRRLVDIALAEQYCLGDSASLRVHEDHVLFHFVSDDEGGEWAEGEGWLASLLPLRAELMAGDLRCLYLAWLYCAQVGEIGDDEPEPPVPLGLGKLSAAQASCAEFLRIDEDLIELAAERSTGAAPVGPSAKELAAWVAALPEAEKNDALVRLIQGEAGYLGMEFLRRFQHEHASRRKAGGTVDDTEDRRTVAELLDARDARREEKRRRAAEKAAAERARHEREQAAARGKELDKLAQRESEAWREVETSVATKLPKEYDRAVQLLTDLRDLGERSGRQEEVAARVQDLRQRHARKPSLLQRMDRAGLPR